MALADNLTAEKEALIALLESEYTAQNLRDNLLERLYYVRFLLGELSSTSGSTITNYALETGGNIESLVTNTQNIIGTDSQTAPSSGVIVGGVSDAGNFKHFNLDSSGRVKLAAGAQNIGSITNITGTVSLPTNAATATNQTTEIGYVVNLDGNVTTINANISNIKDNVANVLPFIGLDTTAIRAQLPASLGAKTAANSLAVTLATDGVASGIANQIGEVQASPTANTVLSRLKTIGDNTVRVNLVFTAQTIGTVNAGVAKAAPGQVFSLYCENENSAKRYLLLLNQTNTPTNGQTPVRAYGVLPSGGIVLDVAYFGANGLSFGNGIAWAFSSTKNTVTLATASDCTFEVGYV